MRSIRVSPATLPVAGTSTAHARRQLLGVEEAGARWAEEIRGLQAQGRRAFLLGDDFGFLCQAWFEGHLGDVEGVQAMEREIDARAQVMALGLNKASMEIEILSKQMRDARDPVDRP